MLTGREPSLSSEKSRMTNKSITREDIDKHRINDIKYKLIVGLDVNVAIDNVINIQLKLYGLVTYTYTYVCVYNIGR